MAVLASDPAASRAHALICACSFLTPASAAPPLHSDGTSRSHCAVSLSLRGEPSRSFLCAPLPSNAAAATSPHTPPSPSRRGWGCCVWGNKTARLLRKSAQLLRETCRLFAQLLFIVLDAAHPAGRACRTRVHTAGDNPDGKPTKNTLFPTCPLPAARRPRKIGTLCKSFAKNSGFSRDFEGKNERKNSPSGLFRRPLSPKTGEKRAENHKHPLRIVHFVVFLTS